MLWFDEVPHEPGCFSVAWGAEREGDEVWLEVKKQKEPPCPAIPAACTDWVSPSDVHNSDREPELKQRIPAPRAAEDADEPPAYLELANHAEIQEQWLRFLIERWNPWAEQHRRWRVVQEVYGRLFTTYNLQKKLGEEYELVLGVGLLAWITPSNQRVRRHLLVGQASLTFDPDRGILSVQAAADGVRLTLETDMLEPAERPVAEQQRAIEDAIAHTAEKPWDRGLTEAALRSWVHAIDPLGAYDEGLTSPLEISRVPKATYAPALILRRRTTRNLVRALATVADQIRSGIEIPFGVRRLCEITGEEGAATDAEVEPDKNEADAEVYFPLPTNREQRHIVQRSRSSQGVLVQGPPGTGKSHTIANLICHLLATGHRVLVTSQTPRALRVLKGKIPRQLSALCVSVLGNDVLAMEELKNSVQGITDQFHTWDRGRCAREIEGLQAKIYDLKRQRAAIEQQLREIREQESYKHEVAGGKYLGTASAIARAVREEIPRHGWFTDAISADAEIPFKAHSFQGFLSAYRRLTRARCDELHKPIVNRGALPTLQSFIQMVAREREAAVEWERHRSRVTRPSFSSMRPAGEERRREVAVALRRFLAAVRTVRATQFAWVPEAVTAVLTGQDRSWQELHSASAKYLEGLLERAYAAEARSIHVPVEIERPKLLEDARELHRHLAAGGGLGWWVFRNEVVKRTLYLVEGVTLNGRPCDNPRALEELIGHTQTETEIDRCWWTWKGVARRPDGSPSRQISILEENQETLGHVLALREPLDKAKLAVGAIDGVPEPPWNNKQAVDELLSDLDAVEAESAHRASRAELNECLAGVQAIAVSPNSHPVNREILTALQERNVEALGVALHQLEQLQIDRALLEERDKLFETLRSAAPELASAIKNSPDDPIWDTRVGDIEHAWAWARAEAWLRRFHERSDPAALEDRLREKDKSLLQLVADLASLKAWSYCFDPSRMKEEHRQHLMAWTNEVRLIGRGTGRYAERHRQAAQRHMEKCREAIPAWIMPFYRVAETVQPQPNQFDVVIVDEASQSGPEALLLQYIGRQMIIVGDDQQISPDFVGVNQEDVQSLIENHLYDFDLKNTFGIGYSLFNHGAIRYGSRIVLREHFRCMPEIIQFSSDLCYAAKPLIPLRQYPPQRLEPIVTRLVSDGFREGGSQSAQNRPEAEAVADAICKCCEDPAYDGKTMGVISLQGEYQARLIERLLRERLDEAEIDSRNLVCGDAYAFQGDERHIMFLSMVAAPNERIGAFTKEADKRRFNVAASRAQDQVWLFHTATVNDLNSDDMRYKLLAFYLNPAEPVAGSPDWARCESQFERDVGARIYERRYRVLPQYEPLGAGQKRIDFVVEGSKARLAVECDGDHWHGPDKYEEDVWRQRQLERAGWVFWRVLSSTFYRDPERALEPLWARLGEMRIRPLGFGGEGDSRAQRRPEPDATSDVVGIVGAQEAAVEANQSNGGPTGDTNRAATDHDLRKPITVPLFNGHRDIDDISQEEVKAALYSSLAPGAKVEREVLLRQIARSLGFARLGQRVRTRLSRAIGAELRAGRLQADEEGLSRPKPGF